MLDIEVTPSLRELERLFVGVQRRQMPFALAVALSRAGVDTRDALRASMDDSFTVRRAWVRNQIQTTGAKKTGNPIAAVVGVSTRASFLDLHVLGGVKRDTSVPTKAIRGSRGSKAPKSRWPGQLAQKGNTLFADIPGSSNSGLWENRARGGGMRLLWIFADKVQIKATWPFERVGQAAAGKAFPPRFAEAFAEAMATAKPRPSRG